LAEKIVVLYISIHYHYRSDEGRITHSKKMHSSLVTLYEASIYLHPINSSQFISEDATIHGKISGKSSASIPSEKEANKFLEKIGIVGDKASSFSGKSKHDQSSHWLDTSSSYTIVERAISNPTSAAALAKRIWISLVVRGTEALTAEDVAEVLGPYRRDEAIECFKVLDENDSGDLRLEEMVWTVIEAGRIRQSIYQGMTDINHCINTLDWIGILILAAFMVFFIAVLYIPTIKDIQNTISIIAVGLSFALGRTIHKFISGCIFIFFEHPFDVGDRVEIYNITAAIQVSAIVTRQSILYTVFRRIDNGCDLQITNERLAQKRIENMTRSGVNREQRTIFVDFKTTFVDLMFLRTELEAFLKDNARDYLPVLGLSIANLHELNKLELRVSVTHKSNWSEERLRATRSNKFMCALLATVRKIPLQNPTGLRQGDEARPIYHVNIDSEEGRANTNAAKKKAAESRIDFANPTPKEGEVERPATGEEASTAAVRMRKEKEESEAKESEARAGLTKIPELQKTVVWDEVNESTSVKVNEMVKHVSTGLRTKPRNGAATVQ
jgi:small-conductance mechanosensitive channel